LAHGLKHSQGPQPKAHHPGEKVLLLTQTHPQDWYWILVGQTDQAGLAVDPGWVNRWTEALALERIKPQLGQHRAQGGWGAASV